MAQSGSPTVRPALVNIEQVAERLGVSVRHMRRLIAERRIPYVKWGHLLRFDPDEVDRWIAECANPANNYGLARSSATGQRFSR